MEKNTRGATQNTPSKAQYFSWINNTNEGTTEEQTLINLDYFRYLHDEYGMQLDIYAWDAGSLDGADGRYERIDGEKISKQYPNGYEPVAKAAAKIGTRMGLWCGPDGFGSTEEEAKARLEMMVSLSRDMGFALFKMDSTCSGLPRENYPWFAKMMEECRKACPDFILLNHRIDLGECEKYATTFLWEGVETYVDVHSFNCWGPAPHHRGFIFHRGNTPELKRLTEDHGVCLSSCLDYFEDDLIIQSFGRNLILAPEIYGNPWLLRDDEHAHLAHIYNLHRRVNDILPNGFVLDDTKWNEDKVMSRGDGKTRFLTFGNASWNMKDYDFKLNEKIGLEKCDKVAVICHAPYTRFVGEFDYGEKFTASVEPFRAALYEICDAKVAPAIPKNCEIIVYKEDEKGTPTEYKIIDKKLPIPKHLAAAVECDIPEKASQMMETTLFEATSDSLEYRSLLRSGETKIPEVKAARDAFFGQYLYQLRGCDGRFAFDGKEDTFFDGFSKNTDYGVSRSYGGCLRVDFGKVYDADTVEFEYFDTDEEPNLDMQPQNVPDSVEISDDFVNWTSTSGRCDTERKVEIDVLRHRVHDVYQAKGRRRITSYGVNGKIRYLRMPEPLDRIYRIALIKDGKEIKLCDPKVNNLLPPPAVLNPVKAVKAQLTVKSEDYIPGCYLCVGLDGKCGNEMAYAVVETADGFRGAPDRAPSYPANPWEAPAKRVDQHYSYYIPVTEDMLDRPLTAWVIFCDKEKCDAKTDVYLCYPNREPDGKVVKL